MEKDFFKDFYKLNIYIGSLARSGSTYLKYSIENEYTPQVYIDKSHSPKIHENRADGIFNCDEFIFAVRPPIDTLKSQLVWRLADQTLNRTLVKSLLDEATNLWEIVLGAPEKFFVLDFDSITSKESEIIKTLEEKHPSLRTLKSSTPATSTQVLELLEKSSRDGIDPKEYSERGHIPREKSKHGDLDSSVLESASYSHRLNYLNTLYDELLKYKQV
jgi:hypothetical protein